ncbi:acyltransferase family protein [Sphingomonas sp.]|uniref:acyltransferase family protein n=1 Tax=Sphingomonas sp. TaxID=28214 RepID=UPI002C0394E1|nr:acyltransferase family protein [Sphingomonas sp.]HTG38744.1 acyltransferase family protein [Sphingomonas sp.]
MTTPARPVPADAARWMDALRAVLAMVVAFSHIWGLVVADHRPGDAIVGRPFYFLAGYAHPAVILFFVLSGFWIAKSVQALDRSGWSWRAFVIARWSRLAIVVIPALVLGGVLDATGLWLLRTPTHLGQTQVWFIETDVATALSPSVALGNLLFLQHIVVPPFGSNGPLWSVAFEFWYYLWFAALWIAARRRRAGPMLIALAVAILSLDLVYGFLAWLAGAAAFHLRGRFGARALVPLGFLLGLTLIWVRTGEYRGEDLVLAWVAAAFLVALTARDPLFPRFLAPLARFGASGSFSLYAIHFPIAMLAAGLIVGPQRLSPGVHAVAIVALLLGASIILAALFARPTEARTGAFRAWLMRRTAGRRSPA